MLIPILAAALSGVAYFLIILGYVRAWRRLLPSYQFAPQEPINLPFLSVILAARNEENHIAACLESLIGQNYPKDNFEVIVVDDASADATSTRVLAYSQSFKNLKLLHIAPSVLPTDGQSFKRAALKVGTDTAKGEFFLFTDADSVLPAGWLSAYAAVFRQVDAVLVGGPVLLHSKPDTFWHAFQALDMAGMMVITGAGYASGQAQLANGANMGVSRRAFEEQGGFDGFPPRGSGDDLFLLHRMQAHFPGKCFYLKGGDTWVRTAAMPNGAAFVAQRVRWASKNTGFRKGTMLVTMGLVYLVSLGHIILVGAIGAGISSCLFAFLVLYGFKALADYLLQREATTWFGEKRLMRYFFPAQLMHTLYLSMAGTAALLQPSYRWKGRKLR